MTAHDGIARWHAYMAAPSKDGLSAMIADDAVFHSPVVHTPQTGKAKVLAYLWAAAHVLGGDSFRYLREIVDGNGAMLEFEVEIDGIRINGVDIVTWNESGLITDFKVMVRPLKAINLLHGLMGARLAAG
jgi:ketosteroid isomerase-like protein